MIRRPVVLITGANGEIGHGLITKLAAEAQRPIVERIENHFLTPTSFSALR